MRITLDLTPAVHHHAGVGRYTYELACALTGQGTGHSYAGFYSAPRGNERPDPPLDRLPARRTRLSPRALRLNVMLGHLLRLHFDRWVAPGGVFHATDHWLPPLRRTRSVFTLFDLTTRLYPEHHLPLNRWYSAIMLPVFLRRADAIIAISYNTQRDVVRWLPALAPKVRMIYPGVNARFRPVAEGETLARVRAQYQLPPRFVLSVCTLEPRKNLITLLKAYRALRDRTTPLPPLVLAGRTGWRFRPILEQVQALGLESCVCFTGWVADDDLPALLSAASVFVYPSLYEGFGLPPLEAMACGTPVVSSNTASLPEIVGNGGLMVDPLDVNGFCEAIERLLRDPALCAELRARGLARAQPFTWERAARETLAVYEMVGRAA